mgnify:CR=1 FL=1
MYWNYWKIALRNLSKQKVFSFINIFGLSFGMAAAILIMLYVHHELSYDAFHEKADRIYRVASDVSMSDGKSFSGAVATGDFGPEATKQIPAIEKFTRLYSFEEVELAYNDNKFINISFTWSDSTFFDIFSFDLLAGNQSKVLAEPGSIVISESLATRIFGKEDPYLKTVEMANNNYTITGVFDDFPKNSHFHVEAIGSISTVDTPERQLVERDGLSFPTYFLLAPNSAPEDFKELFEQVVQDRVIDRFGQYGFEVKTTLQPIRDIHLQSNMDFEIGNNGSLESIYIFIALAVFIVIIAAVNFVNLVTARSQTRSKEIGVRKVLGANRKVLIRQFIGESVIISLIAFAVALALTELFIGPFAEVMERDITVVYWQDPLILLLMLGAILLVGIFSGLYPAFYLASFNPVQVLRGSLKNRDKTGGLRKALVIFQFSISIFLILSLIVFYTQINYLKSKDLGFDREQVLVIRNLTDQVRDKFESLKADLLQIPGVLSVSAAQSVPGEGRSLQNAYKVGDNSEQGIMIHENRVQHGYAKTLGLQIVRGRDFDPEMSTDTAATIINQTAAKKLGLEDPIGKDIMVWNHECRIIGVVKDFNYRSLYNEVEPLALTMYNQWFRVIPLKFKTNNVSGLLDEIGETMKHTDNNYAFDYYFIDQKFASMYENEERNNNLFTYAAVLAIIIAMLGLFALTSFTVQRRIKEIGIRKSMGASSGNIVWMLTARIMQWVLIANLIAWPLAYYFMSDWLKNFEYRVGIYWWMYLMAGILAAFIAFVTVSVQSYKAAASNPVDALRYE